MVQRNRRLLLSAFIALTAALAFAAPLFHAHLDAEHAVAQGLCGDHAPAGGDAPSGADPCALCLASAHASAALVRVAPLLATPARAELSAPAPAHAAPALELDRSSAPRAPPLSA